VEHVDELIAGQSLHALSSDDEERVALHVAECDSCRQQLREAEAVAASLAYAVPAALPPPDLRARVLASVEPVVAASAPAVAAPAPEPRPAARPRRGWWPRLSVVAVPVLAVAVAGLVVWNVSLRSDLSSLHGSLRRAEVTPVGDVGSVVSTTGGRPTLYASLPTVPSDKTYEAWVIRGKVAVPAGIFEGGGTITLTLTKPAKPGDVIAITVEPAGGSKQPTTKPLAAGTI
jgi:anti-sigma-K factor RskA